ncbi:MAG: hypothetical protein DKM50_07600 [Candidatus Margulisiibacteriota bacterium]|nr:MAG: hypothetical protein A2X42_08185 [Candidatus Margulisbacteria bacterium GWF2_38_17]OGI11453.1 MAG: hypothetical protein A2X41_11695 [Candidatus Margulisbacteria bacterium GWE2_39_32]PZM79755.1 MAG: hypothetical protein DKM50_07600 [Candidatus Margulisiibacteriota bacterium]HAR64243.1 hypothetical protein [Candidatus Margulisiibacteriota bacterium]HCT83570.1 hypothetical protein [Candidatus Margulisiibacteriota bacterium]
MTQSYGVKERQRSDIYNLIEKTFIETGKKRKNKTKKGKKKISTSFFPDRNPELLKVDTS